MLRSSASARRRRRPASIPRLRAVLDTSCVRPVAMVAPHQNRGIRLLRCAECGDRISAHLGTRRVCASRPGRAATRNCSCRVVYGVGATRPAKRPLEATQRYARRERAPPVADSAPGEHGSGGSGKAAEARNINIVT